MAINTASRSMPAPSINLIKAHIETEIAPIVGSEEQARDLIAYIKKSAQKEDGV